MKLITFVFAILAVISLSANAQQCPDIAPYAKARAAIQDLGRIVAPSGIQESYKTKIGGIDQWLNVRGQDKANPIILFIHGGPASPLMPTMWQFQRPIEEYFTVVNYDQRGAGKTYVRGPTPTRSATPCTSTRYVDDAIEIAEHVRKRYGKKQADPDGHSWGTIVGMKAALKRPDLFYAYVGIGQVINMRDNEQHQLRLRAGAGEGARQRRKRCAKWRSIAPYPGNQPITRERIIIARKWPQFYGGLSAYRERLAYFFDAPRCRRTTTRSRRMRHRPGQPVHARPAPAGVPAGRLLERAARSRSRS